MVQNRASLPLPPWKARRPAVRNTSSSRESTLSLGSAVRRKVGAKGGEKARTPFSVGFSLLLLPRRSQPPTVPGPVHHPRGRPHQVTMTALASTRKNGKKNDCNTPVDRTNLPTGSRFPQTPHGTRAKCPRGTTCIGVVTRGKRDGEHKPHATHGTAVGEGRAREKKINSIPALR